MHTQSILGLGLLFYGLVYSTLAALFYDQSRQTFFKFLPDNFFMAIFLGLFNLFFYLLFGKTILINMSTFLLYFVFFLNAFILSYETKLQIPELEGLFISLQGLGILLLSSSNLFTAMLLIEIISLILYTLVPLKRDIGGVVAGSNYFLYGSYMALWGYTGLLIIYKTVGSFDFIILSTLLHQSIIGYFGLLLFTCYIFFKLAAFPFHSWAPFIYDKMPQSSLYVFAVITKLLFGLFLLNILFCLNINFYNPLMKSFYLVIIIGSMFYGVLGALNATKINRIIAYSSIVHIGYFLLPWGSSYIVGFSVLNILDSMLFYLATYIFSIALFLSCLTLAKKQFVFLSDLKQPFNLATYSGIIVSSMSMAGLPPTLGFLAKWEIWTQMYFNLEYYPNFLVTAFLLIFSIVINILSIWFYIKLIWLPLLSFEQPVIYINSLLYILAGVLIILPFFYT